MYFYIKQTILAIFIPLCLMAAGGEPPSSEELALCAELDNENCRQVISTVRNLPLTDRKSVIFLAKRIMIPQLNWRDRSTLMYDIQEIPLEERKDVIGFAEKLMTPQMNGKERSNIITTLKKVPQDQRKEITKVAEGLMTPQMNGHERMEILKNLHALYHKSLSSAERKDIIGRAKKLFMLQKDKSSGVARLIWVVSVTPTSERESVITLSQRIFTPQMNAHDYATIIYDVGEVDRNKRENTIAQVERQLTPQMDARERCLLIKKIGRVIDDE